MLAWVIGVVNHCLVAMRYVVRMCMEFLLSSLPSPEMVVQLSFLKKYMPYDITIIISVYSMKRAHPMKMIIGRNLMEI